MQMKEFVVEDKKNKEQLGMHKQVQNWVIESNFDDIYLMKKP